MPENADNDLARAAQGGSREAFGELTLRHYPAVHRFLLSLLANPTDAEDLTQDTFVRAHAKIGSYRPAKPFRPWLFTIARRLAIAHWRKSRPTEPFDESTPHPTSEGPPAHRSTLDLDSLGDGGGASLHDAVALWETARTNLKPDEFSALWFFYREDLSIRELAKVLGKTGTHTKVILHRARTRLRDHLTGGFREAAAFSSSTVQPVS